MATETSTNCKVFVGGLGRNVTRCQLAKVFGCFGSVQKIWIARNPPGFAFVTFSNAEDAKKAIVALHGKRICGRSVRVEMSKLKGVPKNNVEMNTEVQFEPIEFSFNHLPNEILTIILNSDRIPLEQRIQIRRVSSLWQDVIERGLKKKTKLGIRRPSTEQTAKASSPSDITIAERNFTAHVAELLTRLFPGISDLSIDLSHQNLYHLAQILQSYASSLKTFQLVHSRHWDTEYWLRVETRFEDTVPGIASALNTATNLTHLELPANWKMFFFVHEILPQILPTLSRLEDFKLKGSSMHNDFHLGQMIFSALTSRCTTLQLPADYFQWNEERTAVGGSLKHLIIKKLTPKLNLPSLCKQFVSLKRLDLGFGDSINSRPLEPDTLSQLSGLTQLTELRLIHSYKALFTVQPIKPEHRPLSSVKRLYLSLSIPIGRESFCSSLVGWFPNLEQLTIKTVERWHSVIEQHPAGVSLIFESF